MSCTTIFGRIQHAVLVLATLGAASTAAEAATSTAASTATFALHPDGGSWTCPKCGVTVNGIENIKAHSYDCFNHSVGEGTALALRIHRYMARLTRQTAATELFDSDASELGEQIGEHRQQLEVHQAAFDQLTAEVTGYNGRVERFDQRYAGRELEPDEYSRAMAEKARLDAEKEELDTQSAHLDEEAAQIDAKADALRAEQARLVAEEQRLAAEQTALDAERNELEKIL